MRVVHVSSTAMTKPYHRALFEVLRAYDKTFCTICMQSTVRHAVIAYTHDRSRYNTVYSTIGITCGFCGTDLLHARVWYPVDHHLMHALQRLTRVKRQSMR